MDTFISFQGRDTSLYRKAFYLPQMKKNAKRNVQPTTFAYTTKPDPQPQKKKNEHKKKSDDQIQRCTTSYTVGNMIRALLIQYLFCNNEARTSPPHPPTLSLIQYFSTFVQASVCIQKQKLHHKRSQSVYREYKTAIVTTSAWRYSAPVVFSTSRLVFHHLLEKNTHQNTGNH